MAVSRRNIGRRSHRNSNWASALMLELIALLAIVGAAQPVWFQRMLQRLNSPSAPAQQVVEVRSSMFEHPMDAYQPPMLAPVQYAPSFRN